MKTPHKTNSSPAAPEEFVLLKIGGNHKMRLLWCLKDGDWTENDLKECINGDSDNILKDTLEELVIDGFAERTVDANALQVHYTITEMGISAIPVISKLRDYGLTLMRRQGLVKNSAIDSGH